MGNTTFDIRHSAVPPPKEYLTNGREPAFDAGGNIVPAVSQAGSRPTRTAPTMAANFVTIKNSPVRVQFASRTEYYVGHTIEGNLHLEQFGHATRGHAEAQHSTRMFVTQVKTYSPYGTAFALLPVFFVDRYRAAVATSEPAELSWSIENATATEVTLALRAKGKLSLHAVFALPSYRCICLRTYDSNESQLDCIQPVAGTSVSPQWPFLAGKYTNSYRGVSMRTSEVVSTAPLKPGTMKPQQAPKGFVTITWEERLKQINAQVQKAKR